MIRQPMLAAKSTDSDLQRLNYPLLVSPKIDGIRGVVVGGKLLSRSMKPIRNLYTQSLFGRPEYEGLDGELVVGNPWDTNLMQQTSSGVMSIQGKPAVWFYVFDNWKLSAGYQERLESIAPMHCTRGPIITVFHDWVDNYNDLMLYEDRMLARGYEGIMIRDPNGKYKDGRSTLREGGLIKVKRFTDDEAIIIGYEPLMRNDNELKSDERGYAKRSHSIAGKFADEMLGALIVHRAGSAIHFNIGSGFTEDQRYKLWTDRSNLPGRIVKFKHFAVTGIKDAPRMPIFLGFRDPEDM